MYYLCRQDESSGANTGQAKKTPLGECKASSLALYKNSLLNTLLKSSEVGKPHAVCLPRSFSFCLSLCSLGPRLVHTPTSPDRSLYPYAPHASSGLWRSQFFA